MNIVASNNIIASSLFHNSIPYEMLESLLALLNLLMPLDKIQDQKGNNI